MSRDGSVWYYGYDGHGDTRLLTGERALKKVLKVYVNETDTIIHIGTSSGEDIETTHNHPFYVEGEGWTAAAFLEEGDILRTSDGTLVTVTYNYKEKLDEPIKVYNLEVEDFHTYYVTDEEVLVHNDCGDLFVVNESKSDKFALGIECYLDSFAIKHNARTWKDFAHTDKWQEGVLSVLYNSDMKILFNLDGIDNPLLAAQRAASGGGGATDWELLQIRLTPSAWDRIIWYKNGTVVPNPFE